MTFPRPTGLAAWFPGRRWLGIAVAAPDAVAAPALEAAASRATTPLTLEPADRRFTRAIHVDLAGRTPLPKEWQALQGASRHDVVHALVASLPAWEGFYEEELFYFLLVDNFRPSTDAFTALPQQLAEGRTNVREALRNIVSSQFFNARNPGNDTFVTVVLEQLLGMTVQKETGTLEAGKKMYDGYSATLLGKKGASQSDLVRIVVESDGFEPFLLSRKFEAIFGAPPPRKRLAADAAKLRAQPAAYPELVAAWLASQAYEDLLAKPRPKSDRVFVRSLYADLLGRVPDYQEFRRCRNALLALSDSRPLRSVLIKMMLDANLGDIDAPGADRAGFVRGLFLRFLAREPTAKEGEGFTRELAAGGDARLLVRALLTHAEYQSY
jgi:hypothetical protein